jgi:UDP-N-acetylglucosamine 2-epimerase (non-hydrolysing)
MHATWRSGLKVLVVAGTRPEVIKLAPVIVALRQSPGIACQFLSTGQHREMVDQALSDFELAPDISLSVMRKGEGLAMVGSRLMLAIDSVLEQEAPEWVIVQGDTLSATLAGLTAFYRRIRVAHVEAGLRSFDRAAPFPEEVNRRIIATYVDLHFAPTEPTRQNLLREGIDPTTIHVTGNTAIDALLLTRERSKRLNFLPLDVVTRLASYRGHVMITAHRRENLGEPLLEICAAIRDLAHRYPDLLFVFPVHLNPQVRGPVHEVLGAVENILLTGPLAYPAFVQILASSLLVLTDSGGVQEEAPCLGKPVLVMRDVTERPEAVVAGASLLVGAHRAGIVRGVTSLIEDERAYAAMAIPRAIYGDGRAAQRIADVLRGTAIEAPAAMVG